MLMKLIWVSKKSQIPRIILGLSSAKLPISVAAQKSHLSNMDPIYVFPTKTPYFASSNIYPPMLLNFSETFGGGIKSKAVTSSLSGESYLLKVGSFSFVSPGSASSVSKPIFDIKSTKDKNKVYSLKSKLE